jgi:integrase
MPSGACVILREGKRGNVFYIKYIDASGKQVKERLGKEGKGKDGWNERRAERKLGERLAEVEKGMVKPKSRTLFRDLAERIKEKDIPTRGLKFTTVDGYLSALKNHLIPFFGDYTLVELEARPEIVDDYIAAKTKEGLEPKTIHNHLRQLNTMFKKAIRWKLMRINPLDGADWPKITVKEPNILTEAEIARLLVAFDELEAEAVDEKKPWWRLVKRLVIVALALGLRRGELLGLTWRHVSLLENHVRVAKTWVRNRWDTPKSAKSRRTIEAGPRAMNALADQWQETMFRGEDDVAFCHPTLGSPLDGTKLSRTYLKPALKRAGITKHFRPFHDARHTSITHEAAAGNPQAYVQLKAGHSQSSITERYIHAAQVRFPGAAAKGEARMFGELPTHEDVSGGT